MALSNRERNIAILLGVVLVGAGAYQYVIDPYLGRRATLVADLQVARQQERVANRLLRDRKAVDASWKQLLGTNLKTTDTEAQSQTGHALESWARDAGIEVQSLKPDRSSQVGDFLQIRFTLIGNGSTGSVSRLLWNAESSELPLQIGDLRLASRKEGTDDLVVTLSVNTIVFAPPPKAPPRSTPKGGRS